MLNSSRFVNLFHDFVIYILWTWGAAFILFFLDYLLLPGHCHVNIFPALFSVILDASMFSAGIAAYLGIRSVCGSACMHERYILRSAAIVLKVLAADIVSTFLFSIVMFVYGQFSIGAVLRPYMVIDVIVDSGWSLLVSLLTGFFSCTFGSAIGMATARLINNSETEEAVFCIVRPETKRNGIVFAIAGFAAFNALGLYALQESTVVGAFGAIFYFLTCVLLSGNLWACNVTMGFTYVRKAPSWRKWLILATLLAMTAFAIWIMHFIDIVFLKTFSHLI